MLDWNDLKYFLAVARGGSTLAASRALRVSQTTVARRIAALEEAVGLTLFEKRPAGYALTPAGSELLPRRGGRGRSAQVRQRGRSEHPRLERHGAHHDRGSPGDDRACAAAARAPRPQP